jgi:hypothetical protein
MNYYELVEKYGQGKGEKVMWQSTKAVSDALEPMKKSNPEEYWKLMRDTYALMVGKHYDDRFGEWQIEQMYFKDKNGEIHKAPRWSKEQYRAVFENVKPKLKDSSYTCWDLAVTLEMMASDYYCLIKEWYPDFTEGDMDKKFIEMSLAYLNDDDDKVGGKIWRRFNG